MKNLVYENITEPFGIQVNRLLSPQPHLHEKIELVYVISGEAIAHADGQCYEIKTGDVFVTFPNQIHFYQKAKSGKYMISIFSADMIFGLYSEFKSFLPKSNVIHYSSDSEMLKLIKSLIAADGKYKMVQRAGYINLIFSKVMQDLELKPSIQSDNLSLKNIINYCEEHYKEEITLQSVADNMHLSKFYISHLLNSKLNLNFSSYINMLRINAACDMLIETDKKISDISGDVGFGTIRSFNRAFNRIRNMTPAKYRELVNCQVPLNN